MMIFVHTNYATKVGGREGVLMTKASDTDITCIAVSQYDVSFPRDWSIPAVNCTGDGFLSMNCESPLGHRRTGTFTPSPITGFDVVSAFLRQRKEDDCDVCDEITDVFVIQNLSQFPSTLIDDDMEILCRFVSACMTGPAQLRMSMMEDWRCLQGAVTRWTS